MLRPESQCVTCRGSSQGPQVLLISCPSCGTSRCLGLSLRCTQCGVGAVSDLLGSGHVARQVLTQVLCPYQGFCHGLSGPLPSSFKDLGR